MGFAQPPGCPPFLAGAGSISCLGVLPRPAKKKGLKSNRQGQPIREKIRKTERGKRKMTVGFLLMIGVLVFGALVILMVTWHGVRLSAKKVEFDTKAEANREYFRQYLAEREAQFREEQRLRDERHKLELKLMQERHEEMLNQMREQFNAALQQMVAKESLSRQMELQNHSLALERVAEAMETVASLILPLQQNISSPESEVVYSVSSKPKIRVKK